jgi:hypothetical protein
MTVVPRILRFSFVVASLGFAGLALAACGTPEPVHDAYGRWADKYPDTTTSAPDAPSTPPPVPPKSAPPQPQAALPPAQSPPAQSPIEAPPEPPKLEELRGLNAVQLTALLGKPTLLRDESAAQMWQYRSETCVLHLFLYPAQGGEKRVQYVEARSRQIGAATATTGPNECLATLVGAQRLRS